MFQNIRNRFLFQFSYRGFASQIPPFISAIREPSDLIYKAGPALIGDLTEAVAAARMGYINLLFSACNSDIEQAAFLFERGIATEIC